MIDTVIDTVIDMIILILILILYVHIVRAYCMCVLYVHTIHVLLRGWVEHSRAYQSIPYQSTAEHSTA